MWRGKALRASVVVLAVCATAFGKEPAGNRAVPTATTRAPSSPVIQIGMRLRCRFVASSHLATKGGPFTGKVSTKPDEDIFRLEVIDGHLILAGNAGVDRLYMARNTPGDTAFFFGVTDIGYMTMWTFHQLQDNLILVIKQNSYRMLGTPEILSWTSAAYCTVSGGNGLAVAE